MKIVHELNQLDCGGVERVVRNLIKFDKKNEHTIIAYRDGAFRKELEAVGAKIILLPEGSDEVDLEADIIHVHSGGDVSRMALELGKQFPVIETIHSPVRSPLSPEYISSRVGVTNVVTEMNNKCKTIYNGLDYEALVPNQTKEEMKDIWRIPEGVPVIGRLGRLGKDKGLEEWILTCWELQNRGLNFIPLIVGGPARDCEKYIGKLKLMCASLPLNNVIWTGEKLDNANYFQIMDVFLYPSSTEGFGLVFAEAMFNEAVVVTYKNDVNLELFGGYSILTEKSITALADGVEKALKTEIRDELQGIQQNFVESEYSAERMSQQYQELYERSI